MDLCALSPGTWVGSSEAFQRAGVEPGSGRGQLGGFALTVRSRFKRSNAPYETQWAVGRFHQSYYRLSPELASAWKELRGADINVPLVAPDVGDALSPEEDGVSRLVDG
jgi:hypothetical protein